MSVFNNMYGLNESDDDTIDDVELDKDDECALEEQFMIDEISHFSEEERKEFLESDLCQELLEAGRMRRNTIVFLSGQDDIARRTKLSALQLAKKGNDPLMEKLHKKRVEERKILAQIMKKYGHKGQRIAKKSQKDYIKNRMPKNFGRFGGADRVSASASAGGSNKGPKKHGDGLVW